MRIVLISSFIERKDKRIFLRAYFIIIDNQNCNMSIDLKLSVIGSFRFLFESAIESCATSCRILRFLGE